MALNICTEAVIFFRLVVMCEEESVLLVLYVIGMTHGLLLLVNPCRKQSARQQQQLRCKRDHS